MKALLFIFYFLVINTAISQNLVQQKNIRLVYPETTIEAARKIEKYIDSIPDIKNKFQNIYSKKYILLTSKQYEPILKYVNEFNTESQDKQNEFLVFKEKWFDKYYNIKKEYSIYESSFYIYYQKFFNCNNFYNCSYIPLFPMQ